MRLGILNMPHRSSGNKDQIKGSIEPTHGSVCTDVRKLQSMDVLKLLSTKADWNLKCPSHILAYIYSNLSDISTSYFSSKYCLIGKALR